MDVKVIENLLKQRLEDYEIQYASAESYIKEHEEDWKEQFIYAEMLKEPVKENQIFFWSGSSSVLEGRTRELFEYFYKYYGHKFSYVQVVKYNRDKPKEPMAGVSFVKKNSEEYWKALAQSGYLIGDGILPAVFVKKEEQFYVNLSQQPENTGIDAYSLIKKEFMKADLIPESEEETASLAERILKKQKAEGVKRNKKKILFLANWKEEREHRVYIRQLLSLVDTGKYELTVMTPRMGNASLENEFEALGDKIEKYVYRGRMSTDRSESILFHILEKNPALYQREPEVRDFINGLMKREWKRIWGTPDFDVLVLAGNPGAARYYLACGSTIEKKKLLDLSFLEKIQRKYPDDIEDICSVFDCIYTFPDEKIQIKGEHLPLLSGNEAEASKVPLLTTIGNKEYLICDRWSSDVNRTGIKAVEYPLKGSCLVNADLLPDQKRKELLREELEGKKIYLVGKESEAYTGFLPGSTVLDSYVSHYLPGLPAAKWFFGQFQAYYSDKRLEYDRLTEVCMYHKVEIEKV